MLFIPAAALIVLALPGGREAWDYLIADTFASPLTLVVASACFVTGHP